MNKMQHIFTVLSTCMATFCLVMVMIPAESLPHANPAKQDTLRHVVFLDFNNQATDSVITQIGKDLNSLSNTIPEILTLEWGKNINNEGSFSYCLLVNFSTQKDLQLYLEHPNHTAIAVKYQPYIKAMVEVDYWKP